MPETEISSHVGGLDLAVAVEVGELEELEVFVPAVIDWPERRGFTPAVTGRPLMS